MLKPIQDKIILKLKKEEEVTRGGIILSSNSKVKSQMATVIEVGDGIVSNETKYVMNVTKDDIVYIEKGIGTLIEYDEEEYLVVTQNDILAIVK